MAAIGDVVRLSNGWVGVIGEAAASTGDGPRWIVRFPEARHEILESEIDDTLSAPSYAVGDTVSVWPDIGEIAAVSGSDYTVDVPQSAVIREERFNWTGTVVVPKWRLILDNDTRLSRDI